MYIFIRSFQVQEHHGEYMFGAVLHYQLLYDQILSGLVRSDGILHRVHRVWCHRSGRMRVLLFLFTGNGKQNPTRDIGVLQIEFDRVVSSNCCSTLIRFRPMWIWIGKPEKVHFWLIFFLIFVYCTHPECFE